MPMSRTQTKNDRHETAAAIFHTNNAPPMNRRKVFPALRRFLAWMAALFVPFKKRRKLLRHNLLEMRPFTDRRTWNRLIARKSNKKRALIVEPNAYHAVLLPGLAALFADLSFDVTVLTLPSNHEQNAFARVPNRPELCSLPPSLIAKYLKEHAGGYDAVLLTTTVWTQVSPGRLPPYIDYFNLRAEARRNFLLLEHELNDVAKLGEEEFLRRNRLVALTAFPGAPDALAVCPHYFGDIAVTPKNHGVTRFIIVGSMDAQCRNGKLLLDAVQNLHEKNVRNFEIVVVGSGRFIVNPSELRRYFVLRGPLDFPDMYDEMERADFFLALLDPTDDKHLPYRTAKTTGSRLLVLGFRKPFVINELFAAPYEFDERNAVVYSGNELAAAMERAVNMDENGYTQMQNELGELAEAVRQRSSANLRRALGETVSMNDNDVKAA